MARIAGSLPEGTRSKRERRWARQVNAVSYTSAREYTGRSPSCREGATSASGRTSPPTDSTLGMPIHATSARTSSRMRGRNGPPDRGDESAYQRGYRLGTETPNTLLVPPPGVPAGPLRFTDPQSLAGSRRASATGRARGGRYGGSTAHNARNAHHAHAQNRRSGALTDRLKDRDTLNMVRHRKDVTWPTVRKTSRSGPIFPHRRRTPKRLERQTSVTVDRARHLCISGHQPLPDPKALRRSRQVRPSIWQQAGAPSATGR